MFPRQFLLLRRLYHRSRENPNLTNVIVPAMCNSEIARGKSGVFHNQKEKTMKTLQHIVTWATVLTLLFFGSCKDSVTDPNDIGGTTDIELSKVGGKFDVYLNAEGGTDLYKLKDTVSITKNDNGLVTIHGAFGFDSTFVRSLDTALGVSQLPMSAKLALVDTYTKRYGAVLDTTNKKAMTLNVDLKTKITSEGIQEFISSRGDMSQPKTIVKYSWDAGYKYEFTDKDGAKITRTVVSKSTTDDYAIGFLLIKVSKVEETKENDPLIEKITYVANHKFGLVGVIIKTKNGKEIKAGIFPPNM